MRYCVDQMISNECLILMMGRSMTSTMSASSNTRCDRELVCGTCGCMLLVMSDMMTPEMHLRLFVCLFVWLVGWLVV